MLYVKLVLTLRIAQVLQHGLKPAVWCCRLQPGETWIGEMVIRSFDRMWEAPLFEFEHESANTREPPPLVPTNVPNANSQWR
jgi:hypothetical protein